MSFVGSIVSAVVDIVLAVVDIVVQIVEVIIEFIMMLLGYDEITQVIEYFEVHNIPMFEDSDGLNPLLAVIQQSVIGNKDLASELIYASAFQSYKGDIQDFMNYIDDGNYMESFPVIDSYITYPDYVELTAALLILEGVPCTPELSSIGALNITAWTKYWLQENKGYSVENNTLTADIIITSTDPATTSSSYVETTGSPTYLLTITDEVAVSDVVSSPGTWQVDFGDINYVSATDDYTVGVFNDMGQTGTLPYNVATKPLNMHYVSYYYIDSAPAVQYLFVYRVGDGTYPDLDNPQNEINIDATVLHAIPAIPLRISNVDYTTRPAAEVTQIEELTALVSLDAAEILDAIKNDPNAPAAGDLDHIYINFGVRMWDTSQAGMTYLFNMFLNLYSAQGVTLGIYNDTAAGEVKPVNNIIITTADYKYLFQWSYITFAHTTLAAIDADSGSAENGYYYSDMSRFDNAGILAYPYYVSSGKGTYNVGYKADTLTEVANFLGGTGTVNPGTTTGEATNWLQVTARMVYNNTTPVLLDADNTTSDLTYLTPDMVYENNGSGVLRHVNAASEETTVGQSITYYKATISGLDAYTVTAPIGSLKVIDGDSGKFNMVKFNLGHPDDLMAPFIHNFIADLSNKDVTQLFLAGTHASIYIAHYEVITQRVGGFGGLFAIIIIIIVIVIMYWTGVYVDPTTLLGAFLAAPSVATAIPLILSTVIKFAVSQIVKMAVVAVLGDSPLAQVIGQIAGMVAASGVGNGPSGYGIDYSGITDFSFDTFIAEWSWLDTGKLAIGAMNVGGSILEYVAQQGIVDLLEEQDALNKRNRERQFDLDQKASILRELEDVWTGKEAAARGTTSALLSINKGVQRSLLRADEYYLYMDSLHLVPFVNLDQTAFLDGKAGNVIDFA